MAVSAPFAAAAPALGRRRRAAAGLGRGLRRELGRQAIGGIDRQLEPGESDQRHVQPHGPGAAVDQARGRHDRGAGVAWYVACGLTGDGLDRLTATVLADAGVTGTGSATVEVVRRRGEVAGSASSWLVAINHGESDAELPAVGVELLSGERVAGRLVVPPGHVVVVREEP